MENNLIEGINPLTISKITWRKFRRIGTHPSKLKYLKKKHPVSAFFGLYEADIYDGYYPPRVIIFGSNGQGLRTISCRNNDHAEKLCRELNEKLNSFVLTLKETK